MLLPLILAFQVTATHRPDFNTEHKLRESFVVAAESVIDTASAIDLGANTDASDAQRKQLQNDKANLANIAESTLEKEAVGDINDMVFAITACTIQARNNADTTQCRGLFDRARHRAMEALGKHKANGVWVDGPPA
jgi:hypothetical protein